MTKKQLEFLLKLTEAVGWTYGWQTYDHGKYYKMMPKGEELVKACKELLKEAESSEEIHEHVA